MKQLFVASILFFSAFVSAGNPIEFDGFTHYPFGEARASLVDSSTLRLSGLRSDSDGVQIDMDHSMFTSIEISQTSAPEAGDSISFFSLGDIDGEEDALIGSTRMAYDGNSWTISNQSDLSSRETTVMIYNGGKLAAEITRRGAIDINTQGTLSSAGIGAVAQAIGPSGGGPCPFGSARYYQCIVGPGPGSSHGGPCAGSAGFSISGALINCCNQNNGTIIGTCSGPVGMAYNFHELAVLDVAGDMVVGDSVVVVIKDYDKHVGTVQTSVITTSGINSLDLKRDR